jgi:hypothetical protein
MTRIFTSILMAGFMVWVLASFGKDAGVVSLPSGFSQYYNKSKCDKEAKIQTRLFSAKGTYFKCVEVPISPKHR